MKVESKFSISQVYLILAFLAAFIGIAVFLIIHSEIRLHSKMGSEIDGRTVGFIFLVTGFTLIFFYCKNLNQISISAFDITIKKIFEIIVIPNNTVDNINLFARKSLGFYSYGKKVNGIKIITKSGQNYFIADWYYRNVAEIKQALQNNDEGLVFPKRQFQKSRDYISISSDHNFKKFSGIYLLSINGLLFPGTIALVLSLSLTSKNFNSPAAVSTILFFISIWYWGFGLRAHYFLLSADKLIIKSQLWWWRNIEYNLDDIHNVILESYPKQSNSLRINTNDFQTKSYQAGSLSEKKWKQLLIELKSLGIQTVDEIKLSD